MRSIFSLILLIPLSGWTASCEKSSSDNNPDAPPNVPKTTGESPIPTIPLVDAGDIPAGPTSDPTPQAPPVVAEPSDEPAPALPPLEPIAPSTEFRIKEAQFWNYTKKDGRLGFNTTWDAEEGDAIIRDENEAPSYAKDCLRVAKETYGELAALPEFQARLKPILAQGVTAELIFLVVSTESETDRAGLRKLDRDAYFWHWTDTAKKPVLSLNQYEKGVWVWETIATPKSCTQPGIRDIGRYLDWTTTRLAEKGANK